MLVSYTLAEVAKHIDDGISGLELDKIAEEFITKSGAKPGFKGYNGFKNTLCISVNSEVVHGIPSAVKFKSGDIVSVDCGVLFNGFFGDSAFTFPIGNVLDSTLRLLRVTRESLDLAIKECYQGNRLGNIGYVIQNYCESEGFSVVRELVGHGIGKSLHEDPQVANYGKKGNGIVLNEGLVIAIEPMINEGKKEIYEAKDNWTILTRDGKCSAHYEHTVAIGKDHGISLSSFDPIYSELTKRNIKL